MARWRGWRGLVVGAALTLGLIGGPTAAGSPGTWYVAPDGSGGGGCATPDFTRIQDAIDASGPQDTILVCPGRYVETLSITGGSHRGLTLRAVVAGRGILRLPGAADVGIQIEEADNVRLMGLVFEASRASGCERPYAVVVQSRARGMIVRGNRFTAKASPCPPHAAVYDVGQGSWIGYNRIRRWTGDGLSSRGTIVRNSLRIESGGVGILGGGRIIGNAVTDTSPDGGQLSKGIEASYNAIVRGNRIANTASGIFVQPQVANFTIRANRILDTTGNGIDLLRTGGGSVIDNVVLRSGGTDCVDAQPLTPSTWTDNVGATSAPEGLCTPPAP